MLVNRYYYDETLTPVLATEEKDIQLLKGTEVSLALSTETYCTGYTKSSEPHACPKQSKGKKQCFSCSQNDEWLPCLKCDGSTCLQFSDGIKDDCLGGKYSVYLASFGDKVKAGISKADRIEKRWVEQGADYACIIFENVNGQEARKIEAGLVGKGLEGRITLAQKLQAPEPNGDAIKKTLEQNILENINASDAIKTDPKIRSLQKFYPEMGDAGQTHYLQGRVAGCKGPLLLLDQHGKKLFALPLAVGKKLLEKTLADYQTTL
ncbi:DUF2797 domain-containing protein [Candidatus Micrarchaeota archaeon]|nr:DUF2797 domain-containing protein [Candidatus Micrarchaeota archaeon]